MKYSRKIKKEAFHPQQCGWMLFLFTLLLLPNLSVLFFCSELSLFKRIASLFFAAFIWLLPALFFKLRSYFLLVSILLFPAPLEIGYTFLNKFPITEGVIAAVLKAHPNEALELINSFAEFIPIVLGIWISYYWICFKKIQNIFLFQSLQKYLFIALFLLFNAGIWLSMFYMNKQLNRQDLWNVISSTNSHFWKKYQTVYPCNFIYFCHQIIIKKQKVEKMQLQLSNFSFNAQKKDSIPEKEIYLLLIGESARYDHFGINDYTRQTTPKISLISNLFSYKNVYSAANLTEYVLPFILSRATPLTPELQYTEKALPDIFKEAGFSTYWIANQGNNYPFIQRIAQGTDEHYFSITAVNAPSNRDEYLLPQLDMVLSNGKKKKFIVLHTYGSHFQYDMRYSEEFNQFKPTLNKRTLLDGSQDCEQRLINSYDNTILYTDYIISETIKKLQQQNAVSAMIYLSDHAESLYDKPDRKVLHGNTIPNEKEVHIPMIIWLSDSYRATYPEKVRLLTKNQDKRLSSTNLFDTFVDIANIYYPSEMLEQSFASSMFKEDSLRYILTPRQQIISKK